MTVSSRAAFLVLLGFLGTGGSRSGAAQDLLILRDGARRTDSSKVVQRIVVNSVNRRSKGQTVSTRSREILDRVRVGWER